MRIKEECSHPAWMLAVEVKDVFMTGREMKLGRLSCGSCGMRIGKHELVAVQMRYPETRPGVWP